MKKLFLLIAVILIVQNIYSQETQSKFLFFSGVSLSLSNGEPFSETSYPSIENGIMYKNVYGSVVIGRENLTFSEKDCIENYFYELKVGTTFPIGCVSGTVFGGYGKYFSSLYNFIEFGAGISYTYKKFSYGINYSNWNNVNYVTPSLTFNW